ncbi:MAG TPA: methyltransferase domain-containing protein [Anaerolineae bacterium]|nr:methyltransferase domain-containing protein [Anaerolineae bacterium]
MIGYLDLEAYLGSEFIHPGAYETTEVLLHWLALQPGELALDLGCGTGGTAVLAAGRTIGRVIALDRSPAMLAAAQARLRGAALSGRVHVMQSDANGALPFRAATFGAVYAESVVALTEVESVVGEGARILRPGGRLALTERIWKPGVTQSIVDEVNRRSQRIFGIPAATRRPLDRDDWLRLLHQAGLVDVQAFAVDTLLPVQRSAPGQRQRIVRWKKYLSRPPMIYHALRFKTLTRRYAALFDHLESCLFLARKPE